MRGHHQTRKIDRTPEEKAQLLADRQRYQREKLSPEQLLAEGGHEDFLPMGELLELHRIASELGKERVRKKMTLAELSTATGIDAAALSRLESGINGNPTIGTLSRIALAFGKLIHFSLVDLPIPQEKK